MKAIKEAVQKLKIMGGLPASLLSVLEAALREDTARKFCDCNQGRLPCTCKPAEQHQGEPVAISEDMSRLMDAYRLGEFTAEGGSDTIESLAVEAFDAVADHGHDADSYMAGFCASLYWQAAPFIGLAIVPNTHADPAEVERLRDQLAAWQALAAERLEVTTGLRTQLAEAHSLLRMVYLDERVTDGKCQRIEQIISASAEPSAPFKGINECEDCGDDGQTCTACAEPERKP